MRTAIPIVYTLVVVGLGTAAVWLAPFSLSLHLGVQAGVVVAAGAVVIDAV